MGFNIRQYQLPPGTLVKTASTIYGTSIGIIRTGAWGTVINHSSPGRIRVLWLPADDSASGVVVLTTSHLSVTIAGYTTTLEIINFPDGVSYEPW